MRSLATRLSLAVWMCMLLVRVAAGRGRNLQAADTTAQSPSISSYKIPAYSPLAFKPQPFSSAFANLWSPDHQHVSADDLSVNLTLDHRSGTGFKSSIPYYYGIFSAAIKLPTKDTAGVAITFYTSNTGVFEHNHDELDFEFLGVLPGEPFVVQTNVYGNGSIHIGREQRFHLWFDPTTDFHHYSILWTPIHIVFSIDGIPIRELKNSKELGAQYPSKPMSVYGTIWDASTWATEGGKYKTNYTFAPFVATYKEFVLYGCSENIQRKANLGINGIDNNTTTNCDLKDNRDGTPIFDDFLTSDQEMGLQWVRKNYMVYDYCTDFLRYPHQLPECSNLIT